MGDHIEAVPFGTTKGGRLLEKVQREKGVDVDERDGLLAVPREKKDPDLLALGPAFARRWSK